VVRSEKVSGISTDGREELATLLQFLRDGDTLVVSRIDRLARSLRDLENIVHDLRDRAADRHLYGRRQVFPRHARRVLRI
jgi:DNA invertase Pin-like site-specific DNA recombinase